MFDVETSSTFNELALEIFRYQSTNNLVYGKFLHFLGVSAQSVSNVNQIPFLPIEVFKTQKVVCGDFSPETTFTSSGTTGAETSQHLVRDLAVYKQSFEKAFQNFYGAISNYCVLALLPAYLERENSSLVYMANELISQSKHPQSGFYLHNLQQLANILKTLEEVKQPTLLLGVSFALLDLAEQFPLKLENTIVMETGGMKGRRKELTRNEIHQQLKNAFGVNQIHSEYGMTELLSQAYSQADGLFSSPPWMQVLIRDQDDPMSFSSVGKTGGINVIDLANIDSCSFIATSDLGKMHSNGQFEVLGRFDHSTVRGCNLLIN